MRGGEHQVLSGSILNDRNYPSVSIGQAGGGAEPWEIKVNKRGERYLREDEPDVDIRDAVLPKQPEARAWVIFDQQGKDRAPRLVGNKSKAEIDLLFGSHMMFSKAPSIEELAHRAGVDGANLKRTVEEYNAGVRNQSDRLGRTFLPAEIAKPPYYAIELHGSNIIGFGGLAVDPDMRVLRRDGSAFRNLYAAGEVIGFAAVAGNAAIGGTGVTPALTFGRMVGLNIMAPA